jgi:multiple antibiotic resistance protein
VFIALTRRLDRRQRHRAAWQAALVALAVILAFALFGRELLDYLGVQLAALEGAGGLLLLLVALELLTGKTEEPTEAECEKINVAFVPLGTPLLAGPGAIVAAISSRPCCSCSGSIMEHRWLGSRSRWVP